MADEDMDDMACELAEKILNELYDSGLLNLSVAKTDPVYPIYLSQDIAPYLSKDVLHKLKETVKTVFIEHLNEHHQLYS